NDAIAITAGLIHTCALKKDTSVVCWGYGGEGQLGVAPDDPLPNQVTDGSGNLQPHQTTVPVQVQNGMGDILKNVTGVAAGDYHTCAMSTQLGTVLCWGSNDVGQLGRGFKGGLMPYPKPVIMAGTFAPLENISTLAAGAKHACAGQKDGPVYCWGNNDSDQLGTDWDIIDSPSAVKVVVENVTDVKDLAAGKDHSCALLKDDSVKCWGSNAFGQLGISPSLIDPYGTPVCDPYGNVACSAPTGTAVCDPYGSLSCADTKPVCTPSTGKPKCVEL
ncbi:MAG: hypothetical protein HYV03_05675, partial [Deltaproteobacteria bacterium]|nr:hypothetical protein [Deltaproteobacteria bacterium]